MLTVRTNNDLPAAMVCHWCKTALPRDLEHPVTTPEHSAWPGLPGGAGVLVCGESCPSRPDGAPVGRHKKGK